MIVSDKNSQIYDELKFELHEIASRRTNFGERSEPAPDRGGKLHSAGGGAAQSNISPLYLTLFFVIAQKQHQAIMEKLLLTLRKKSLKCSNEM